MTTLGRFALSLGVAAALAGCGSSQGAVAPSADLQTIVQRAANNFAGEKFTSTYVSAACLLTPGGPMLNYMAMGSATGPLPGTFSASGSVFDFALKNTLSFSETFEVQSGTQTFSGKVKQSHGALGFGGCRKAAKNDFFKANRVWYSVDRSRGRSSLYYSKRQFHESFY
ncbi:MAG TPA: hypothetical protein VKR56_12225 [Candidatus Cybelea sp.]|nr:hypothetical protein [Candidatus Cybelea sp.]